MTRDPAQSDAFSDSILRLKYHLNALTPFLVYEFGPKFNVAARYRNTQINYVDTDIGDSDENRGIFDFIYNLNRRNSIDLQYQYWQKNYDVGTDYTSNQIKLIFRRQMRAFDIIVGGGYQNRKFDDSDLGRYRRLHLQYRYRWGDFREAQGLCHPQGGTEFERSVFQ